MAPLMIMLFQPIWNWKNEQDIICITFSFGNTGAFGSVALAYICLIRASLEFALQVYIVFIPKISLFCCRDSPFILKVINI